jgi:hypothetical protein
MIIFSAPSNKLFFLVDITGKLTNQLSEVSVKSEGLSPGNGSAGVLMPGKMLIFIFSNVTQTNPQTNHIYTHVSQSLFCFD